MADFEFNERVYTIGAGPNGATKVLWWCYIGHKDGKVVLGHPRKGLEPIISKVSISAVYKAKADAEAALNPSKS